MTDDLAQRAARHRPRDGWPTCPRCGGPVEHIESEVGPPILMARPWMHLAGPNGQMTHCGCALCSEGQAERDRLRAALADEQVAHLDDNQRLYERAVEATRGMLDEANARAERAEQQLAVEQVALAAVVAERDELLIYRRVVEVNGITQYDQTGSAWELIQQLREQLAAEQAARARAEAVLHRYVDHAEYSISAGHAAYMEVCLTCQDIVTTARDVLAGEEASDGC